MAEPKRRGPKKPTREQILEIYATQGATPAAKRAKVHKRTVQRWAREAGISSGFEVEDTYKECPSFASYLRGCRCDGCKLEARDGRRVVKERRLQRVEEGRKKVPHGVSGYSNWNCRCPKCKRAWSAYLKGKRRPFSGEVEG